MKTFWLIIVGVIAFGGLVAFASLDRGEVFHRLEEVESKVDNHEGRISAMELRDASAALDDIEQQLALMGR